MNTTMRKETPDSDAVASSEDERPWPAAPSFGTLPRKENGMPGISGGIWSTQKRGSFKLEKTPQRPVARDSRLGAIKTPRSILRSDSTPSPSASDGSGALPVAIPLQPTPKAGRSLSHSQGQREGAHPPGSGSRSNEQSMVLSLGYLAEEFDTETESELGGGLTHTTSHPPIGTLQRMSTLPPSFDSFYGVGHSKDSLAASGHAQGGARAEKNIEAAFANLALDPSQRRSQWQTHLGWDDVPNVNESRRHSMADIPTRRGSLVGIDGRSPQVGGHFWSNGNLMYNWDEETHSSDHSYRDSISYGNTSHELNKSNDASSRSETLSHLAYNDHNDTRTIDIPSMYRAPNVSIAEHERPEQDKRGQASMASVGHWNGGAGGPPNTRPRKLLYMVTFKCSRVEVFYLLENTGLSIKEGDIVIVEADRGQDLGTVQHANVTPDEARLYKRKYGEEQYKWLMMFSKNNAHSNVNPNAQLFGENSSGGGRHNLIANAPATMQGSPRGDMSNLKPKAIKRLANGHEIRMLSEKEGNEAKAKRACQQKVAHLHLDMEILDAEWQWDFQKLIFYYYADHYINFKDLITELYRIYKTRIWMSAINPASFSQHAAGQPPSGIGPGAVGGFNPLTNSSYTMMYGADPDPYGAIPPYRIGYDTYTPNYPGIPGVANSFAPPAAAPPSMAAPGFPQYGSASGDVTPSGLQATGTPGDLQYYYDRNASQEQTPRAYPTANPFAGTAAPADYYPQPLYLPPGFAAPPSTTNERAAYGYGYSAYGNPSPAAGGPPAGSARQSNMPAPIGTRAPSMGNSALTPTSFGTPPTSHTPGQQGGGFGDQRFRAWPPSHAAAEFVPGQQQQQQQSLPSAPRAQASGAFFGGAARPGTAGQGAAPGGGIGIGIGGAPQQTVVKEERMKAFLEGLGRKDGDGGSSG